MDEVTRMLEESPRKMSSRVGTTTSLSPTKHANLPRKQSAAALSSNHSRNRHHRVHSYQQLIQQRPSISFDPTMSRANTRSTSNSGLPSRRLSYETVRPSDRRQSFDRKSLRPVRSSLETRILRGLRNDSVDETGPRLQRSTSGLGFDDTSTEVHADRS